MPTFLRLLGVPCPRLDGEDIWSLAVEGAAPVRDHVVSGWTHYPAVRDREWNMIVDTYDPENDLRLLDVRADPDETRDVAKDHPDVVARQVRRLEAVIGMPLPAKYQHRHLPESRYTVGGLRETRRKLREAGDHWMASNLV